MYYSRTILYAYIHIVYYNEKIAVFHFNNNALRYSFTHSLIFVFHYPRLKREMLYLMVVRLLLFLSYYIM